MEPGRDRSRLYQCCHSDAFPQFPLPSGNAPVLSSTADAGEKSSAVARAGMIYLGIKPVRVPWSLLQGMASAAEIDLFTAATGSGGCSRENTSQTQAGIFQPLPVILEQPREGTDPMAQPPDYQGNKKNPKAFQILEVRELSRASWVPGIFQGDSGLLFRGDSRLQALIPLPFLGLDEGRAEIPPAPSWCGNRAQLQRDGWRQNKSGIWSLTTTSKSTHSLGKMGFFSFD